MCSFWNGAKLDTWDFICFISEAVFIIAPVCRLYAVGSIKWNNFLYLFAAWIRNDHQHYNTSNKLVQLYLRTCTVLCSIQHMKKMTAEIVFIKRQPALFCHYSSCGTVLCTVSFLETDQKLQCVVRVQQNNAACSIRITIWRITIWSPHYFQYAKNDRSHFEVLITKWNAW